MRLVPNIFDKFQGYNDLKRKKLKSQPLDTVQCDSHSSALFSLASRAVFNSSSEWRQFKTDIESLAECISLYRDYLQKKLHDRNKGKMKSTQLELLVVIYLLTFDRGLLRF